MEAGVVVFVRPVRVGGGGIEEDVVDEGGDIDFAGGGFVGGLGGEVGDWVRGDAADAEEVHEILVVAEGGGIEERGVGGRAEGEGRVDDGGADDLAGDGIAIDAGGGGVFEDIPVVVRAAEVVGHEFLVGFFVEGVEPPVEPVEEAVDGAGVERAAAHVILEVGHDVVADVVAALALSGVGVEPCLIDAGVEDEGILGGSGVVAVDIEGDGIHAFEVHGELVAFPALLTGAAEDVDGAVGLEAAGGVRVCGIVVRVDEFEGSGACGALVGDPGFSADVHAAAGDGRGGVVRGGGVRAEAFAPWHDDGDDGEAFEIVCGEAVGGVRELGGAGFDGPVGACGRAGGAAGGAPWERVGGGEPHAGERAGLGDDLRGEEIGLGVGVGRAEAGFPCGGADDGGAGDGEGGGGRSGGVGGGDLGSGGW